MMRFYVLTDRDVLAMPHRRFFALYRAMRVLQLEEEGRALSVAHAGKPADRLREIMREIGTAQRPTPTSATPGIIPTEGSAIEAERRRQIAAAESFEQRYAHLKGLSLADFTQPPRAPGVV